jgi:hypothetical protein
MNVAPSGMFVDDVLALRRVLDRCAPFSGADSSELRQMVEASSSMLAGDALLVRRVVGVAVVW